LYARSENLRDGNDQILNGLQEGLFVIDETKGKMRFLNEAGNTIIKKDYLTSNAKLNGNACNQKNFFVERKVKKFALIEK